MLEAIVESKPKLSLAQLKKMDMHDVLRDERDFEIRIGGKTFFHEHLFPILELARYCLEWKKKKASDFEYVTLEAEENPLISLTRSENGWRIASPWQQFECGEYFRDEDVRAFADTIIAAVAEQGISSEEENKGAYLKRLWPYIKELLTFIFVMAALIFALFYTHAISVKWSGLLILYLIVFALWFFIYVFNFVPFAVMVIIDLIRKDFRTEDAVFVEAFIFKSSSMLDRIPKRNESTERIIETLYYKVVVVIGKEVVILTSSEYFELKQDKTYRFTFGRRSKALVDVNETAEKP